MIHVDRPADKRPTSLDARDRKTKKTERERAEAIFGDPDAIDWERAKKFKFEAYGGDDVREALNQLFGYKCAYCESFYGPMQPVAVEHWRPKGEVETANGTIKPGYWWLASEWTNLLPSCTDCNSARYHTLPDGTAVKLGKGNLFPVATLVRPLRPGVEDDEGALLLHPCVDPHPEEHLEFLAHGLLRAALAAGGAESAKGSASIPVYGLMRPLLVQARKQRYLTLMREIHELRQQAENVERYPTDSRFRQQFKDKAKAIKGYLDPREPYSAMATQIVRRELPELVGG